MTKDYFKGDKITVSKATFYQMSVAAHNALLSGKDAGVEAWKVTGLPMPLLPTRDIQIVVDDTRAQFEAECG